MKAKKILDLINEIGASKELEDEAANAIRDLFLSKERNGYVSVAEMDNVILNPKGRWARLYGFGNLKKAWEKLNDEDYIKKDTSKGDKYIWVDYER